MRQSPDAPVPHGDRLGRRGFLARTAVAGLAGLAATRPGRGDKPVPSHGRRISYYCNGEIHVNVPGEPEGTALTTGHDDFKPSWSKTDDRLVCFRRTKDDPVTVNWKSAIFIINADGTGFHLLSDGARTDFNPTWTRDGANTPIWNRKNDRTGAFHVMQGRVGGQPGQEVAITDDAHHTWVYSSLIDGRLLVSSLHPKLGWGYYLLTRSEGGEPAYEAIECDLAQRGLLDRVSVSPSETKVCFEFQKGFEYRDPGRTLYVADFDAAARRVSNPKAIANAKGEPYWFAYPRWIEGEAAVVYHRSDGKGQLHVYRLDDGSTTRVSTNPRADYRYPHGEAAPC